MFQRNGWSTCAPASSSLALAVLVALLASCELRQPTDADATGETTFDPRVVDAVPAGEPLAGLSARDRSLFQVGRALFQQEFTPESGLGPLFNAVGCANCHENPVVGGAGGGDEEPGEEGEDIEVHATAFHGGTCDLLNDFGGPVFQKQATEPMQRLMGMAGEEPAAEATAVARRTTPDLFGFGLLDAVPDGAILRLADPGDLNHDGISGRAHMTADGRVGRFGRKADVATLNDFNAGAFLMEMGITSAEHPLEQFPGGPPGTPFPDGVDPTSGPDVPQATVDAVNAFVRFLAPPPPSRLDRRGREGRRTFGRIGCADCHVPSLPIGRHTRRDARAFDRHRTVFAYTDLLLHDMGPELADICVGDALPEEFRTEPLMGLRFNAQFLHDGRAESVEEAIAMHGGEATRSRERYESLSQGERDRLLQFLQSL